VSIIFSPQKSGFFSSRKSSNWYQKLQNVSLISGLKETGKKLDLKTLFYRDFFKKLFLGSIIFHAFLLKFSVSSEISINFWIFNTHIYLQYSKKNIWFLKGLNEFVVHVNTKSAVQSLKIIKKSLWYFYLRIPAPYKNMHERSAV
jgi:hypothetical protein